MRFRLRYTRQLCRTSQRTSPCIGLKIRTTGAPYQSGTSKATCIFLALRYLHVIASQTLARRPTTLGNVTTLDTYLLSHIHRGISIEMRSKEAVPRAQAIHHPNCVYLELDIAGSNLTEVSPSTIIADLTVLRNMGMVEKDEEGLYTLRAELGQQEQQPSDISMDPPVKTPPQPLAPPFVPRTAFKRFVVQQLSDITWRQRSHSSQLEALEVSIEDMRRELHELHESYCTTKEWTKVAVEPWFHDNTVGS